MGTQEELGLQSNGFSKDGFPKKMSERGHNSDHRCPAVTPVSGESTPDVANGPDKTGDFGVAPYALRRPRSRNIRSKDHKRRNTHKLVLQRIVPCMNSYGLCIVDDFLGNKVGDRILQEVRNVHHGGKMRDGELSGGFNKSKNIRGDQIAWVEGNEPGCENIGFLLTKMDKLITYADGRLGKYKIRGRHKVSGL